MPLPVTPNEATPLLKRRPSDGAASVKSVNSSASTTVYFTDGKHRRTPSSFSAQGQEFVNPLPTGSKIDEFAPRPLSKEGRLIESFRSINSTSQRGHMKTSSLGGDLLKYLSTKSASNVGAKAPTPETEAAETGRIGTLLIPRKVPVKVEPKVFLANERTLLTWLHVVVTLALASMTIIRFAAEESAVNIIFGLILLPTSLAFVVYALFQCEYLLFVCQLFLNQ